MVLQSQMGSSPSRFHEGGLQRPEIEAINDRWFDDLERGRHLGEQLPVREIPPQVE